MLNENAKTRWFALAVSLAGALAGCLGPLSYQPPQQKKVVVASAAPKGVKLPPQPDPKVNNATVAGVDTTGLGIRDDVDLWIYANYSTASKRSALTQAAKALQAVLVNPPKNVEDARKMQQAYDDAILKLKEIPGIGPAEPRHMDLSLYDQVVNTPQRLQIYLQYNLLLNSQRK